MKRTVGQDLMSLENIPITLVKEILHYYKNIKRTCMKEIGDGSIVSFHMRMPHYLTLMISRCHKKDETFTRDRYIFSNHLLIYTSFVFVVIVF